MITLNSNSYKTILLDTNALQTLATSDEFARKLLLKFCQKTPYVFCMSIYNIIELKPKEDLYNKILMFFTKIPCILFFPYKCIIEAEYNAFSQEELLEINNTFAWAFSPMNNDLTFEQWLNKLFQDEVMLNDIANNIKELPSIAKDWESQRNPNLSIPEIMKRIKEQEETVVMNYIKDVIKKPIDANANYKNFPAARMMLFSQCKRVHLTKKKILPNDVMDIQISTVVPYVDAVITETTQAEIYKQAKTKISKIANLEIYTLKDVKNLKEHNQ